MKALIFTVLIFSSNFHFILMMTDAQMKSTAKLMRNVCQPKNKISNDKIEDMHRGVWDESKEEQCYMLCVLQMMKAVNKAGTIDYDFSYKQVASLPPRFREPTYVTLEECKTSQTAEEPCMRGYQLAKCMYFRDPEFYFLP